ncbi:MAG: hypothetical protein JNN08_30005 [Bryobacterales bacterium]|nr:hypothetical protein [Bryobacterales bacterium]
MDSSRPDRRRASLDWRLAAIVIAAALVFVFSLFTIPSSQSGWGLAALSAVTLGLSVWVLLSAQPESSRENHLQETQPPRAAWPDVQPLPLQEMESQTWEILHHLTTVNGYCDLILHSDFPTQHEHRSDIAEIRYAGERALLGGLYLQWLIGCRKPQGLGISLNPLVLDLQPRLEAVLPAGVSLQLDLDPQAGLVVHDPDLMEWMITSLVLSTNAPAVVISTKPSLVEIRGAGHVEMTAAVKAWQKLGGRITTDGQTAILSAAAVLEPLVAPRPTL